VQATYTTHFTQVLCLNRLVSPPQGERGYCGDCDDHFVEIRERVCWWGQDRHIGWEYHVEIEGLKPGVEVTVALAAAWDGSLTPGPYSEPIVVTPGKDGGWTGWDRL
jgi:hypothetical protein